MTQVREFDSREALFAGLADYAEEQLAVALSARGAATLAVPGGTTPAPFFHALRGRDLDWPNVKIMLTDERFVPESSDRSNTRLLHENLLQEAAQAAQYVPLYAPAETPENVLDGLSDAVEAALPLDFCVLGMGTDMHTASIFPGADKLAEALSPAAPMLLPMRAPGAPEPRITLTAPVLKSARATVLLITGAEKRAALKQAMAAKDVNEAPVKLVLHDKTTVFYAD